MPPETVRLRIGNLAKAVLVTGQAYQDPKDALNEFVSNAADEYAVAGRRGGRIRIVLRRKGKRPVIAVDDDGRGLTADQLRAVARSLFESRKAGEWLGRPHRGDASLAELLRESDQLDHVATIEEAAVPVGQYL